MTWGEVAAWGALALATIAALCAWTWWFARLYGKICVIADGLNALREWIREISEGKGPVCVKHDARLDGIDRELENHGRRLSTLEQQKDIRRKPS